MLTSTGLIFYHAFPSRSTVVRWMLEEIGEPYDTIVLNLRQGDQLADDYRTNVNPMGKVPALKHDGVVVTECAAICCYLADVFPQKNLAPAIGDPLRGPYLRWLFFSPSCIEPAIIDRAYPRAQPAERGTLGWGDYDSVMSTVASGLQPGPYLLGDRFSAADVVIGSLLRWAMMFNLIDEKPVFRDYVDRLNARPALIRATQMDQALITPSDA